MDAATGAATARKHRTSSSSSFDATTAMPRRKSPEEAASQRPAWDTRATSRDGRVGGGARLAANLNSFADAAAMRRDPSPARAAFANKTGDRAAACARGGESPGGGARGGHVRKAEPSALNTCSRAVAGLLGADVAVLLLLPGRVPVAARFRTEGRQAARRRVRVRARVVQVGGNRRGGRLGKRDKRDKVFEYALAGCGLFLVADALAERHRTLREV